MSRLADPTVAIQEWAVAALSTQQMADALGVPLADVPLRIWDSTPPSGAAEPYVELMVSEPRDVGGVGMAEVMASAELTAKAVGQAESYDVLKPVAEAIHASLHGEVSVPVSGSGIMLAARRVRAVAYPEHTDGIEYRHLGGTYAVNIQ
jgi:hypothetical protein